MSSSKDYLKKSIMVGAKMVEAYDISKIRRILVSDKDNHQLWEDDVKKMNSYILSYGGKTEKEVIYNFGINSNCDYGRIYADRSFGQLWSAVKNTVSHEDYIDIDMVNSQASIMWQMAIKDLRMDENILPQFKRYIEHRDEYFDRVMKHYNVSKKLAKLLFTSLMNGGSLFGWKQANKIYNSSDIYELNQFKAEADRIAETFIGKRPDIYAKIISDADFKSVDTNITSKVFSRVVKNIEALCVEKLYIKCGYPRYGSLEHDGIRIRRDLLDGAQLFDAMYGAMADIESDRNLGYSVQFIVKVPTEFLPMADQTEIDGNFEIFDEDYFEQLTTYEDKKKYFEIFHFKTITPKPKYQHLCWINQDYGRLELHEWDSGDVGTAYCNRFVVIMKEETKINKKGQEVKKTKPEEILFTKKWLKDANIRTYNRIDFIPYNKISSKLTYWDGNKEVAYNSFLGYSMKCNTTIPENGDKLLKIWTDLVFELCGANERFYNLYVNSLADKIQFPNKKSKAGCFVFKSSQGAGKNMSLVPFEVLLGEYYISSSEERDFWGTHADAFYRKIIINLNEMQMGKDSRDSEGKIKAFISEEWMTMNQKFKNLRKVRNTALPIFYTNGQKPFSIDFRTGDRRLNVAEATEKYIELNKKHTKEAFWGQMNTIFRSDKFIATFYDFLNKRDLSNVDWTQVKTTAYMDMAFQYHTSDILFICDWVEKTINFHNAMNEAQNKNNPLPTRFNVSQVFEKYREFCNEFNIKPEHTLPQHKFMANLTDLKIGIISKKSSVMVFDMDLQNVKKILIEKEFLKSDILDSEAGDEKKEEEKDSTSLCDMYGLDISEFI
jgi:uncharacterized protein YozE (UPF0346 family)